MNCKCSSRYTPSTAFAVSCKAEKCNLCLRHHLLPMSREGHQHLFNWPAPRTDSKPLRDMASRLWLPNFVLDLIYISCNQGFFFA